MGGNAGPWHGENEIHNRLTTQETKGEKTVVIEI